ncbi:putative TIR domain-containing protein [Helianthus annuus]|uniref:TIR domain-containing protein n=1 Tax=Helianthus annuus TaxID=4232 RepID=A0A9K3H179_HELAN|nr:putative TIR domain-containing protein [Helianthus annuus]KAJ0453464.1 putative TIR domain-containing protein [Helianthus annuus]KAJ0829500.1 putative TIR domain-containing protein [Helianthus annuus]
MAEDTSKNFVDYLCHTLHQKGIITYKDEVRIEKGERINEQLMRTTEDVDLVEVSSSPFTRKRMMMLEDVDLEKDDGRGS